MSLLRCEFPLLATIDKMKILKGTKKFIMLAKFALDLSSLTPFLLSPSCYLPHQLLFDDSLGAGLITFPFSLTNKYRAPFIF